MSDIYESARLLEAEAKKIEAENQRYEITVCAGRYSNYLKTFHAVWKLSCATFLVAELMVLIL